MVFGKRTKIFTNRASGQRIFCIMEIHLFWLIIFTLVCLRIFFWNDWRLKENYQNEHQNKSCIINSPHYLYSLNCLKIMKLKFYILKEKYLAEEEMNKYRSFFRVKESTQKSLIEELGKTPTIRLIRVSEDTFSTRLLNRNHLNFNVQNCLY